MKREKTVYLCQNCGAKFHQWQGRCLRCGEWGTIQAYNQDRKGESKTVDQKEPIILKDIPEEENQAISTGSRTIDSLLGNGLMPGSATLLAGEPGVGKSTFLLQLLSSFIDRNNQGIYISGEESLGQLKRRAERLQLSLDKLLVFNTSQVEDILPLMKMAQEPGLLIVDSVQTLVSLDVEGIQGSVSQVRTVASVLMEAIKKTPWSLILVGHVTKEGQIAGPKLLEHMVDTVVQMEGDNQYQYRVLRVLKNRFGPTSRIVFLEMADKGLRIVHDPSTFFLQARDPRLSGTAVVMACQGQRPFAVEIQALVSKSFLSFPKRTSLGFDNNRLNLLLAIMEKKLNLNFSQMDVFAKIGGGLSLREPSLDLGIIAALLSSYYEATLPEKAIFWGEVDLNGQIRPVYSHSLRLKQARQLKNQPIICPEDKDKTLNKHAETIKNIFQLQEVLYTN